ncbi:MAG TPA: DUF1054 domain-containing protein [Bavariicoccus seileri]|uniref:UPF0637 protein DIW15_00890 n=1 Tax=Bavariicoccus seileri TaxID=549685 RepID=A0A3D4S3C2_9ENTE|nr:DUF1054 domain-containing protein [Bavariicoccus seileri]HCS93250.1 DUF1054 domain-containing protein [Bavariicoccus seileri]
MFTRESFDVFLIEGLEPRMAAIREQIQPTFQELDDYFKEQLEKEIGHELFVHIAQHRRRTTYAPENTWSALSRQKRGYKMEPHFQLGIWPDYVFMWLSCIDRPKNELEIATTLLDHLEVFEDLPKDFVLSGDHTKETVEPMTKERIVKLLTRFRDVKKGEFQIGRIIPKDSDYWAEPEKARAYMLETYQSLLPSYEKAMSVVSG